ncbi:hypothetical protein ZWY2020_022058 [Hordeum vulgare]|nr:hypothetical protein ZWY2020_022058 [Hordeum vulgare]
MASIVNPNLIPDGSLDGSPDGSPPPPTTRSSAPTTEITGDEVDPLDNVFRRLDNSLLTLDFVRAALAKSDPFDLICDNDKAFIEASKITTLIAAGAINAVNVFGTTLAMSGHHPRIGGKKSLQGLALSITLISVPFTLSVAALAHATEHCPSWINKLAYMMYLEYALLAGICGMYGYLLTDADPLIAGVIAGGLLFLTYICILTVFRRPSIRKAERLKKVTTASEQLRTMMRAELKTPKDIEKWLNTPPVQAPAPAVV